MMADGDIDTPETTPAAAPRPRGRPPKLRAAMPPAAEVSPREASIEEGIVALPSAELTPAPVEALPEVPAPLPVVEAEPLPAPAAIAKPAPVRRVAAKPVAAKRVPAARPVVKPALPRKPATPVTPAASTRFPKSNPTRPTAKPTSPFNSPKRSLPAFAALPFFQETFAMNTTPFDFTAAFKTAFTDAQDKAKAAYEKSTEAFGEAGTFAKGNVEAVVESSRILAAGLQELTSEFVAGSRSAFESMTAEVKSIAAAKSPAEFFSLQSELAKKHLDALLANSTKHSETMLKLVSDAAAPLSSRVNLAAEKLKTAA